jgi:DNA-directed RNA polymerase subunit RPC12/RpoP
MNDMENITYYLCAGCGRKIESTFGEGLCAECEEKIMAADTAWAVKETQNSTQ